MYKCANEDSDAIFNSLCSQFSNLLYGRSQGDREQINKLLDSLNNLDHHYPIVKNSTKAVLLVHQCCSLIAADDCLLVPKYCQLLTNLINLQHIQIEGQTLKFVTIWCLNALKDAKDPVNFDVLLALEALLGINRNVADILLNSQFSSIISINDEMNSPKVIQLYIHCLVLCTVASNEKETHLFQQVLLCANVFLTFLRENKREVFDDITYYKLLISCLRGLHNVIIQNREFLDKELGLLLGICKSFMTFGIRGVEFLKVDKIVPSVLSVPDTETIVKERRGGKVIKKRRPRTSNKKDKHNPITVPTDCVNEVVYLSTSNLILNSDDELNIGPIYNMLLASDSDFSDTDYGRAARLDIARSRIRQGALDMLLYIVKKTEKNTIFTYWSCLIPDGSVIYGTHHLSNCILRDPSPKGRMASLKVLLALLIHCKVYLVMAESSNKHSPFTSFSVILGSMLIELHRCLSLALHENSNTVLIQVLKCLAALVQATPYHKLPAGIITKIMRNVKVFLTHRDATVQVAALIVLGYILGFEPVVPETKTALLKHLKDFIIVKQNPLEVEFEQTGIPYDDDYDIDDENNTLELPWLLKRCLTNLGVPLTGEQGLCENVAAPIKLESLQVITAMAKNYFDCLLVPYLTLVTKAFEICLCDSYCDLRLHTGRTIDFFGQAITQNLNITDHSKPLSVGQGLIFWQTLLNNSLIELLNCEEHWVLRAVGCDCLGSIAPHIFEHLPKNKQILIMTLLVGSSRDEESNVRAAAVRALAICVVYPTLREDVGFVADVADAICRTLEDESVIVRIKSSWSLGNLSDALVLNKSDSSIECIPDNLLLRLLEISIKCCTDTTKIKVNAVRALGNLLQLITKELIEQKTYKDIINDCINSLLKILTSSSDMKLKWNCCYAIGSIFKNPVLLISEERKHTLFAPLLDLVMNFRNFKVRINAALALACPNTRELYGQYFVIIWNALLTALENTQNVEDFNEYNHRDHLVEQICLSLGHMTVLLGLDDLFAIKEKTFLYIDLLQQKMHRTIEHLIPEKSSLLLSAYSHLNALAALTSISEEHKEMITVLLVVFSNPIL